MQTRVARARLRFKLRVTKRLTGVIAQATGFPDGFRPPLAADSRWSDIRGALYRESRDCWRGRMDARTCSGDVQVTQGHHCDGLAMQLVEQGKLSLDQPLSRCLPPAGGAKVLEGFDASQALKLRPAKRV